jgi:hypothetical protein
MFANIKIETLKAQSVFRISSHYYNYIRVERQSSQTNYEE